MNVKITLMALLLFYFTIINATILIDHRSSIPALSYSFDLEDMEEKVPNRIVFSHQSNIKYKKNTISNLTSMLYTFNITNRCDFYENLQECIEITHILDSYCCNKYAERLLHFFYYDAIPKMFFDKIQSDNSLYFTRLAYLCSGIYEPDQIADKIMNTLKEASVIERSYLLRSLSGIYDRCSSKKKQEIIDLLIHRWTNMTDYNDSYFLTILYYGSIKRETNNKYDKLANNFGTTFYGDEPQLKMPLYFKFTRRCSEGVMPINPNFTPNFNTNTAIITILYDEKTGEILNTWYKDAYNDLISKDQILDADFIFYWFRNAKNEIMIDLARQHIQNQDFKDARYKAIYYLVNHDFDYSFPNLAKMVQDGSLHINEKKNFYRGLARLNKLPYSVLTKDQQQKANDYLKQQMHNEQDISIKLYIDFLLSICLDEYGLSNERTSFLNSLKEIGNLSQEDISQIDRRLKIIKYSIYTHSPSIFDSYVNGLTTEKPFIDVSKVDIHMLPVYEAEANGETWYYHDVNSEAYIATNTNKYKSLNLTIPQKLGIFPVVGITEGAFGSSWHSYTNIVIPKSVTYISYQAFAYNTNLLSIAIPNTVTNIGYSAFKRSNNISTIFLEEGSIFEDKHLYNDRDLTPNCKIIRTKFENGLPIVPPKSENNN